MSNNVETEKALTDSEKNANQQHHIVPALEIDVAEEEILQAEDVIKTEAAYSDEQFNRLRWKIDLVMMPLLMLTYGLQYSDKVSLSSGVIFGLREDTGLVGQQYALLSTWFYIAYLAGQLPMQWLLQRVPLGKGLATTVVLWGICVTCLGACNNFIQLTFVRLLLGWFECAITPGFLLIVASWYKRSESTLRSCLFFAMNTFFSIIFGIAIYYIALNAQQTGQQGWRIINYFLGAVTIFDGLLLLVFLGTPSEVWWLTAEQKKMAHARVVANATGGGESHPWKWSQVKECFRDPQFFFAVYFNLAATIPNGALGAFSPLVYTSFGFSNLQAILFGLPSNAIGCVFILISAVIVNRQPRARFPIALIMNIVPMIVFLYVGLVDSAGQWQKWACFSFVSVFAISTFMTWSIIPQNTAGRTKKSFLSACLFMAYCAGNIVGSNIFLPGDAPKYLRGLTACAIVMATNTINLCLWWMYYLRTNKRREQAFIASNVSMEEREHLNKLAGETDMTDLQNPHFRYSC